MKVLCVWAFGGASRIRMDPMTCPIHECCCGTEAILNLTMFCPNKCGQCFSLREKDCETLQVLFVAVAGMRYLGTPCHLPTSIAPRQDSHLSECAPRIAQQQAPVICECPGMKVLAFAVKCSVLGAERALVLTTAYSIRRNLCTSFAPGRVVTHRPAQLCKAAGSVEIPCLLMAWHDTWSRTLASTWPQLGSSSSSIYRLALVVISCSGPFWNTQIRNHLIQQLNLAQGLLAALTSKFLPINSRKTSWAWL